MIGDDCIKYATNFTGYSIILFELALTVLSIGYCYDLLKAVGDPFDNRSYSRQKLTLYCSVLICIPQIIVM